jgi:hypothetical protein
MVAPEACSRSIVGPLRGAALRTAIALVASLVLSVVLASPAHAGSSLRCGNRLVSDGSSMDEVFRRCGEPTFRTVSREFVSFETPSGVVVTREIPVETWTYNRGPREFVRYLTFRNGHLLRVSEGDYGY